MSTFTEAERQAIHRRAKAKLAQSQHEQRPQPQPQQPQQPPPVLNAGEKLVRQEHQRQRPALDDETMKLWNAWLDARCEAIIDAKMDMVADETGAFVGERETKMRNDIRNARGSMLRELRADWIKALNKDLNQMRDDLLKVLRKDLSAAVTKMKKDSTIKNTTNVTDIGTKQQRKI